MKTRKLLLSTGMLFCAGMINAQYVDLTTGKTFTPVKHEGTGMMMNPETQRPVHIYINTETNDTLYGRTGEVINGKVVRTPEGRYSFSGDGDYIFRDGEYRMRTEADSAGYKKKMQSDGDVKVKYDGYKRKVEKDGDVKIKDGDAKVKVEEDGTMKVKEDEFRGKIDKEGNIRVKDDNTKVKYRTDGKQKIKDKRADYKGKVDGDDHDMKEKQGNKKYKMKHDKIKVKDPASTQN